MLILTTYFLETPFGFKKKKLGAIPDISKRDLPLVIRL